MLPSEKNPIDNDKYGRKRQFWMKNYYTIPIILSPMTMFDKSWLNCHILFQDELLQIFIGDGRTIRIFSFSDIGLTTLALEIDFGNSCSQENLLWHRWEIPHLSKKTELD